MRKADYAALARILLAEMQGARSDISGNPSPAQQAERMYGMGRKAAANRIARNFAAVASVNRAEFLKACGIDP